MIDFPYDKEIDKILPIYLLNLIYFSIQLHVFVFGTCLYLFLTFTLHTYDKFVIAIMYFKFINSFLITHIDISPHCVKLFSAIYEHLALLRFQMKVKCWTKTVRNTVNIIQEYMLDIHSVEIFSWGFPFWDGSNPKSRLWKYLFFLLYVSRLFNPIRIGCSDLWLGLVPELLF